MHPNLSSPRPRSKPMPSGGQASRPDGPPIVAEARTNPGALPDKVPGEHRFAAMSVHAMRGDLPQRWAHEGAQVLLDLETLVDLMVGCLDCERALRQGDPDGVLATRCDAPARDWYGS